ncbi:hypothetical protein Pint_01797 [Pistacia integerrima]|uniref:Uncharacterized protein n=1 Tax=Pistacia integerrima TaxID=434235 RepID=A0ACC0ZI34_9ROSI|nr:hypothetical protein Pint_01797 [Pistacia integerrima]
MDITKSCRMKAFTTAIAFSGVETVALKGNDKSLLEVTGDGIDLDALISLLSMNVAPVELLRVINLGGCGNNEDVECNQIVAD